MKYVSCWIRSAGGEACMMPVRPPMMNMLMKPMAHSIGVFKLTEPLNIVPIQLKIFTPVGTAMSMVLDANTASAIAPRPTANMWWAHTPNARKPMARSEEHTSELQSHHDLVCRLLLEKKNNNDSLHHRYKTRRYVPSKPSPLQ